MLVDLSKLEGWAGHVEEVTDEYGGHGALIYVPGVHAQEILDTAAHVPLPESDVAVDLVVLSRGDYEVIRHAAQCFTDLIRNTSDEVDKQIQAQNERKVDLLTGTPLDTDAMMHL